MLSTKSLGREVNGSRARLTKIGVVHTTETKEHKISYETASWYTLVDVPPGDYDVVLSEGGGTPWILVQYHGVITDEHFVNRLFQYESLAPKRDIGKEASCSAQLYDYIAAEQFAKNPEWELAEDWRVEVRQSFYSHDGRPHKTYRLIPPEGPVSGQRVWVRGENQFGIIESIDRDPANGINVRLGWLGDGDLVSAGQEQTIPEDHAPVVGATYHDWSRRGLDSKFTIVAIRPGEDSAELDNGQWYELDGPEGLLVKLRRGTVWGRHFAERDDRELTEILVPITEEDLGKLLPGDEPTSETERLEGQWDVEDAR